MKANPSPKAIPICNSHEPTLDQKLQKSMSCQRTVDRTLQQIERKIIEDK